MGLTLPRRDASRTLRFEWICRRITSVLAGGGAPDVLSPSLTTVQPPPGSSASSAWRWCRSPRPLPGTAGATRRRWTMRVGSRRRHTGEHDPSTRHSCGGVHSSRSATGTSAGSTAAHHRHSSACVRSGGLEGSTAESGHGQAWSGDCRGAHAPDAGDDGTVQHREVDCEWSAGCC